MSIAALVKATLVGHEEDKQRVLAELQELGCLHLIPLTPEGEPAEEGGPSREAREALRFLTSCPQRRRQVSDPSHFDPVEVEQRALELQRRLHELCNERDFLAQRIEALAPWGEFEFPRLEEFGGQRLWFYAVPHHQVKDVPLGELSWEVVSRDWRFCYVAVLAEEEPEAEKMPVPRIAAGSRSPRELRRRLEEVEVELEDVEAERISLTRWCTLFARALDGLEDLAARGRAAAQTAQAQPVYALQAWLARDRSEELRAYAARTGLILELSDPNPGDQPPTLLCNSPALQSGEDLVRFYMTPSYWVWDPSSVVFFSFAVFFAMILADAGYGLLLGAGVLAYWKKMEHSDTGRRWRVLLGALAGATLFYGVMVGSYFGVSPPPGSFWGRLHVLDLKNFSAMMALSVGIGVAHVSYACVRDGLRHPRWPQRLAPFGWAAAVVGGFGLWGGSQLGLDLLARAGGGALCGGLLLVVLFAGSGERPFKRIGLGIAALTGVTGAFGDVLSYMRLFALGLASASLALTFNDMASQIRDAVPGLGLLLALLVLLVGHAMNFLLSLSSGFIHGLRLNVIEFFKWGVKDEGTPYQPFERKESTPWTTSS